MTKPSKPIIALYVFDSMVDWEYGHLLGAITQVKAAGVPAILRIMAESPDEIRTLGRLPLRPVRVLPELSKVPESMDTLILVGGTTWDTGHDDILAIASCALEAGKTVGAIGGATLGLARKGLLNGRAHTSNSPELLQVDGYHGADHYVDERVVVDGNLITAPSISYLEFTREILRTTGLLNDAAAEAWHQMFRTGERSWEEKFSQELTKQVAGTP